MADPFFVNAAPAKPDPFFVQPASTTTSPDPFFAPGAPTSTSESFGEMLRDEGVPTNLDEGKAFLEKQKQGVTDRFWNAVHSFSEPAKQLVTPYEPTSIPDAIEHQLGVGSQLLAHAVPGGDFFLRHQVAPAVAGTAAAVGTDEAKKIYEQITGKPFLTPEEISALPTMEERDAAERDQSTLLSNIGSNIKDLIVGVPRSAIAAVQGLDAAAKRGYEASGPTGAFSEMAGDTARESARLALKIPQSIAQMANDGQVAYEQPVSALANAAMGSSAIKALAEPTLAGKVVGVARAVSPIPIGKTAAQAAALDKLRPTNIATNLLQQATKDNPTLAKAAQWTLDARAGVPEAAQEALSDNERLTKGKTLAAQDALKAATKGMTDAQKNITRDVLTGEDTRAVRPNWPEQVMTLQPLMKELAGLNVAPVETLKELANNNPGALDELARTSLPNYDPAITVKDLNDTLSYRAAQVIDNATGEDLSSPGRILFGGAVPKPADISVSLNPFSHLAERAAPLLDRITGIRQQFVQAGNEANGIDAGGRPLLSDATYNRNLGYYLPDIHDADVVKDPGQFFAAFPKARGGPFLPADLKNNMAFAQRALLGASTDLDKANAIGIARAYNNIGKYDLFQQLANAPGLAISPKEFAALPEAERARYIDQPISRKQAAPGTSLKSYGALAGKHLDQPTFNLAKNMNHFVEDQTALGSTLMRAGSIWKTAHTVLNPSTWADIIMSNGIRSLWMNGLMGVGNYAKEITNQIRRGITGAADKDYWDAARRAGITSTDTFNLKEAAQLTGQIDQAGSVPKGVLNYVMGKPVTGPVDFALTAGERLMKNNPAARAAASGFMSLDNAMRMAAFKDFFTKAAEERGGVDPKSLLEDPALLKAAYKHVEQFIPHMNYQNAPMALGYLDRYGVLPFGRFAWRTLGTAADAAVTSPNAFLSSVHGGKLAYDKMSPEDKRRIDIQPQYARGNMFPITPRTDLNNSYYLPFGNPEDLTQGGRSGSGETAYKPGWENFMTREIGGPVGAAMKIVGGKNPLTDKDLFDNMGLFGNRPANDPPAT